MKPVLVLLAILAIVGGTWLLLARRSKAWMRVTSRIGIALDLAATVALVLSAGLLLTLLVDLFASLSDAPLSLRGLRRLILPLVLLAMPTICCIIVWPIHLDRKLRGKPVFSGLRFVVLASAAWMWFISEAFSDH